MSSVWMNKDRTPFRIRIEGTFLVPETDIHIYETCAGSKASDTNDVFVSNWGRNWISILRLLPYPPTQKLKSQQIKETNVQNKILPPLEKSKLKYIECFRLS